MRKKGTAAEWDRVRGIAANLFDAGEEPARVAELVGVAAQTARAWRRAYRAGGRAALVPRTPPGRPPELAAADRERLAGLLEKTPAECGFDRYLWTTRLIADLVAREFGVAYHRDHVGALLGAMGFTHQKPARRARERDETAVAGWRRDAWPALLKKSADAGGVILPADEVGREAKPSRFMMTPTVKRTWARRGRTPTARFHARRQKKVSVLGAVALRPATGRVELVCDFHPDGYVRGPQAAAFLHRVLAEHPAGPVDLVWDNLSAHRSGIVKEVLAEHPRLALHYLPPCAPDLNPAEGVWSLTKYHRMANHTIGDLPTLHAEAARHLADVGRDPALLRSCFDGAGLALSLPSAQ